jgi:hypothetical protein
VLVVRVVALDQVRCPWAATVAIAGAVTAVGDGVDASWVGGRVWAITGIGGGYGALKRLVALSFATLTLRQTRARSKPPPTGKPAHFRLIFVGNPKGARIQLTVAPAVRLEFLECGQPLLDDLVPSALADTPTPPRPG